MFNNNSELNDFTPSWLKLPANGSRPPLNWLQDNAFQSPRRNDTLPQKDDFTAGGAQRMISSAWTSPRPSPLQPVAAPPRPCPNRMYKAVLPRNMTKRVLSRTVTSTAPSPDNSNKDSQIEDNNNHCSEAEERLLREMGWDELQAEGPLTDEEITNFKHLNRDSASLQKSNTDKINGQSLGFPLKRKIQVGSDLKKILLATMGVTGDDEEDDTEEDSDEAD